jgi:hypothetical protein
LEAVIASPELREGRSNLEGGKMHSHTLKSLSRFLALWLTVSLAFQSPAFALRETQRKEAGLEELEKSLKSGIQVAQAAPGSQRSTALTPALPSAVQPESVKSAGLEEEGELPRALRFGDPRVWKDEEKRTQETIEGAITFLKQRREAYGQTEFALFSPGVVNAKIEHLENLWESILAEMSGQRGPVRPVRPVRVEDLYAVQPDIQEQRFRRIVWGPEITRLTWKDLPYNVAQSLIFSEIASAIGFFDDPGNPLTDFYRPSRDERQEQDLWTKDKEPRPRFPIYTGFVLGGHRFADLASLALAEKQKVLRRALILTLKGNALDPYVREKLKVGSVEQEGMEKDIILDDSDALVKDLTSDAVQEVVVFQDNVGVELVGLSIFTSVYLKMYPDKKVTWVNKEAPYLISDVVRRDIRGWGGVLVEGMDSRSWLERFQDSRYTGNDPQVQVLLLTFLNEVKGQPERFEVLTHPWTESGFSRERMFPDLAARIGGPARLVIAIGEWLNERFANGIPYPRGTSYETAWGYLGKKGIQRFALLRMIKDAFIVVIPPDRAEGIEIVEGGKLGMISYANFAAGLEDIPKFTVEELHAWAERLPDQDVVYGWLKGLPGQELNKLLQTVERAYEAFGPHMRWVAKEVVERRSTAVKEQKLDKSVVTDVEKGVQNRFGEFIQRFDSMSGIGEEGDAVIQDARYIAVWDPIDGTANYILNPSDPAAGDYTSTMTILYRDAQGNVHPILTIIVAPEYSHGGSKGLWLVAGLGIDGVWVNGKPVKAPSDRSITDVVCSFSVLAGAGKDRYNNSTRPYNEAYQRALELAGPQQIRQESENMPLFLIPLSREDPPTFRYACGRSFKDVGCYPRYSPHLGFRRRGVSAGSENIIPARFERAFPRGY